MWDRIATQKVGIAIIDALLGVNSIHKLELLDIQNHFELGETGSFKGIKYLSDTKPQTWKSQYGKKFIQG
jgi:hypothetical protein